MTILLIILAIVTLYYAIREALRYHVRTITRLREQRNANYHIARALADQIETSLYARDRYRAALIEISRTTQLGDPSGDIARRFLKAES